MSHEQEKVDCFRCKHFFVTYDKHNPRGCRYFGFKSKELPSKIVFLSSGKSCLNFEAKPNR